ncbi:MAG: hypothetical protein RJA99_2286 [Pseudomonadota bacterium]
MATAAPPADRLDCYEVGGAVRDALLGLPVHDRDWVVVGATPERMVELGFRPVGRDFPVFLHPLTHEEFALARTERKSGRGYRGFVVHCAPEVTLEEDLHRRDLTINAMARAPDGTLVDPWGGERDLRTRVLRHVSDAFAEDPVRILRTARFAARFAAFSVAPETLALMRRMVDDGEVDALVPERVWQEVSRGLGERHPSRMLAVLRDCGALARLEPELDAAIRGAPAAGRVVDAAAAAGDPPDVRFAALVLEPGDAAPTAEAAPVSDDAAAERARRIARRLKAPNDARDLAVLAARERRVVARGATLDADAIGSLIERCDALRKPMRFAGMLRACDAARLDAGPLADDARLRGALAAARAVDAGEVAARAASEGGPAAIAAALRAARVDAIAASLRIG